MTISDEMLAAFADGELDEFAAAKVRRAIEANPELAMKIEELRALKTMLSAHFDPVLAQPVPASLTAPIEAAAKVVDLSAVREARKRWFERPVIRYAALPALAASLLVVVFVGRGGESGSAGYAAPELAAALDGTLSGETAADGTKMLLSFRDQAGSACRAYAGASASGIACHDNAGWKLVKTAGGLATSGSEFQQAGSGEAEIMAAAQDLAIDGAMAPEEEATAKAAGWKNSR